MAQAEGAGEPRRFLAIYLSDHFAGATVGVELARRVRSSNRDDPELGAPLAQICAEIEADRETLRRVMDRVETGPGVLKPAAAWLAEKLGRLKPNGQLRGYSPLSRLVELEALSIGIGGKIELWKALEAALGAEWDGFHFGRLCERAERQRATVEELHLRAAATALGSGEGHPRSGQVKTGAEEGM
jgi:hypothetical protein